MKTSKVFVKKDINKSYEPAKDYLRRAEIVMGQIFDKILYPGNMVLNIKWNQPSPEMMKSFAHELPGVLNWFSQALIMRGIEAPIFKNEPLCEEDLADLEHLMANIKSVVVEDDKTNEKCCVINNKLDGYAVVVSNKNYIMVVPTTEK